MVRYSQFEPAGTCGEAKVPLATMAGSVSSAPAGAAKVRAHALLRVMARSLAGEVRSNGFLPELGNGADRLISDRDFRRSRSLAMLGGSTTHRNRRRTERGACGRSTAPLAWKAVRVRTKPVTVG
ncbi:hypothetical protein GCM10009759_25970 [Kitasatospora saccharophila]|uniref:Uncharacterized protein n=1 Tax=Kitasatospora saccharophila TaxID=407973 RepID=A0ABP5I9H3_9ACTN